MRMSTAGDSSGIIWKGQRLRASQAVVYRDEAAAGGMGALADKLQKALEKKKFLKVIRVVNLSTSARIFQKIST